MKLVVRLAVLGTLALAGGAIALYMLLPSAARTAVEVGSQEALGVPAALGGLPLSVGPDSASLAIEELAIANPEPFEESSFFEVDLASVTLDTASVLSDVVRIRELRLDGTRLNLLQRGSDSNLAWFLKRLPSGGEGPTEPETAPASEEPAAGGGKLLAVDRVVLSGLSARLRPCWRAVAGVPSRTQPARPSSRRAASAWTRSSRTSPRTSRIRSRDSSATDGTRQAPSRTACVQPRDLAALVEKVTAEDRRELSTPSD